MSLLDFINPSDKKKQKNKAYPLEVDVLFTGFSRCPGNGVGGHEPNSPFRRQLLPPSFALFSVRRGEGTGCKSLDQFGEMCAARYVFKVTCQKFPVKSFRGTIKVVY